MCRREKPVAVAGKWYGPNGTFENRHFPSASVVVLRRRTLIVEFPPLAQQRQTPEASCTVQSRIPEEMSARPTSAKQKLPNQKGQAGRALKFLKHCFLRSRKRDRTWLWIKGRC